jgi:chloride channel 3/4/5
MRDFMHDHKRRFRFLQKNHTFLELFFENSQSWILISLVGIIIGFIAGWVDVVAVWLTDIRTGRCSNEWYSGHKACCQHISNSGGFCDAWMDWSFIIIGFRSLTLVNWVFYVFFSVLLATICAYLVDQFASYAAGSGTAEIKTMLGGFMIKGFLGFKTLVIKVVGLPLVVASGLAVGKEGPMIHVASCVGHIIPWMFPKYKDNEAKKREIVSCAVAAGVASAFGAPMVFLKTFIMCRVVFYFLWRNCLLFFHRRL